MDSLTVLTPPQTTLQWLPLLDRLRQEVRQELHHVIGSMEGASDESLTERQATHLMRARASIDRLLRTVNDLISLASPEPLPSVGLPLCVEDFMGAFATWFAARAKLKGLDFQYEVHASVPKWVVADRELIETVVCRVLENCIQSTDRGGVKLSLAWSGKILTFDVADTGGMRTNASYAGEVLPHEAPTDELWLWIACKRLHAVGGELTLVSNTSLGAVFRIGIAVAAVQPPGEDSPQGEDAARSMRILVAEDHDDSFLTFEMLVKSEGHHLFRARNGREAVEMALHGGFDLIVMDVGMPQVDGYSATRIIRDWEMEQAKPRSPIVLLSADDPGRLSRMGASVGCSAILNKPVRKQELIQALRHYSRH